MASTKAATSPVKRRHLQQAGRQTKAASTPRPSAFVAWVYDAGGHDREIDLREERLPRLGADALLWIDLEAGDEGGLEAAAELLKLPDELVTRLASDEVRP